MEFKKPFPVDLQKPGCSKESEKESPGNKDFDKPGSNEDLLAPMDVGEKVPPRCDICEIPEEDNLLYGPIMTQDGVSVHYFCLLFTFHLMPNGCDIKDMAGFKVEDIKVAIAERNKNKKRKKCYYVDCMNPNIPATAVCNQKQCKRYFHVPCGMKHDALFQFYGCFESFCDNHGCKKIDQTRKTKPKEKEICSICLEPLGPYIATRCFQPQCCIEKAQEKEDGKEYWFHYSCVMLGTRNLGYHFNCFSYCCGKTDPEAKDYYLFCGIFIPSRLALYETREQYKDIDKKLDDEDYFETTYDQDATLFQVTFVPLDQREDCDFGETCIGNRLGKFDIVTCSVDNCSNYGHVKCLRYFRHYSSNEETRKEKFYCKSCFAQSCLALV